MTFCLIATCALAAAKPSLKWEQLPLFPKDHIGVAGPFVGVHNDVLIVAGGANFPEGMPW
ncbi:MAG: galactose oxidase, partial [Verrucomicrobiales bacterium]|nr:galactose oxidase [Verrucomicrobiales bacterium]